MTTLSKEEYLAKSRGLQTGFGPTTDFADPQLGSTVQSEDGIPTAVDDLPGQVFSVDQLPDPDVARAYGLPPVTVPEHLILGSADDALKHVQGKSALDAINGQLREELGHPTLAYDNTIRSAGDALQVFADNTGAGVGDPSAKDDSTVYVNGIKGGTGDETETTTTPTEAATGSSTPAASATEAGTQGDQSDAAAAQGKASEKKSR